MTTKFNVGDCVTVNLKIKKPEYSWGAVRHGDVGIIVSTFTNGELLINFPKQHGWRALPGEMLHVSEDDNLMVTKDE